MVPITIVYKHQLHCASTHDPSGATLTTDAPKDNFGNGESFSPTDLVTTALGSCMITTMGIIIQKEHLPINIDDTKIALEKHMSIDAPRRIVKLVAKLSFPAGIPLEYRARLQEIGDTCPMVKSLHPDIALDVHYIFQD